MTNQLLDAVHHRDVACVLSLLNQGADINAANEEGRTPLMLAAKVLSVELVRLLVEAGADVTLKDHLGYTAAGMASYVGEESHYGASTPESREIIEILQAAGG